MPPADFTQWRQSRSTSLSISHVSKLWREIAINTPILWSKFDVFNIGQPFTDVCFARSKNTLLDLELYDEIDMGRGSGSHDDYQRAQCSHILAKQRYLAENPLLYRNLLVDIPRWRSLKVAYVLPDQLNPLHSPAPHLEVFHFNNVYGSDYADPRHSLPSDIFEGHAPRLRDIKADHVYVPLTHPILTSLTRLCLRDIDYSCSSVDELLRVLKACPLLERLELARLLFPFPGCTPTPVPIDLPNLRDVVIETLHPIITRRILASVILPPTSRLKLFLRNPADLGIAFAANTSHLEHFSRIRSLFIDIDDTWRFCVRAKASEEDTHYLLDIRIGNSRGGRSAGIDAILRALGRGVGVLSNVETFSIDTRGCVPSISALTEALAAHSSIKRLSLSSIPGGRLESLLVTPTSHPCPLLDTLCVRDCDDAAKSLVRIAQSRRRVIAEQDEVPLRALELENCTKVDSSCVLELGSLGVEVTIKHKLIESSRADI